MFYAGKEDVKSMNHQILEWDSDFFSVKVAQILQWFIDNGYTLGQVVTQGINTPVCKLYEKCGYHSENEEYFYHF